MLISADVKGLEVVCAAFLSGDEVLKKEIRDGVDIHARNQADFKLTDRLTAKRFKFKMIYGGTAFGFAKDVDFEGVKYNEKQWQRVIDSYYEKYYGMKKWHGTLVRDVMSNGTYVSPFGRTYDYRKMLKEYQEWYYIPKIKNFPVQGLGADVVMMARIVLFRRLKRNFSKVLLVNTIHDSIVLDVPKEEVDSTIEIINGVFQDLPSNLSKTFDVNFDLPLSVEMKQLNGEPIK